MAIDRQKGDISGLDNKVQANISGGLNTLSSPLTMPLEDAPKLLNMKITQSGTLRRRKGTQALSTSVTTSVYGSTFIPYTLRNGFRIIFAKEGTSLKVYTLDQTSLSGNQTNQRLNADMTFTNVWSAGAAGVRVSHVITSEPTTRILMACGINTVVQASICQSTAIANITTAISPVDTGDARFKGAVAANIMVYRNGVYLPRSQWTFNSATGVVSLIANSGLYGTISFDVIRISWQWWTEAMRLLGKQINREVSQFQISNPTDLTVAVPTDLLYDIEYLGVGNYPLTLYSENNPLTGYIVGNTTNTATSFVFTQGAAYVPNATPTPGFTHVAFGAFTGALPQPAKRVIFYRHYRLPFRGYAGVAANKISVFDTTRNWTLNSGWVVSQYITPTAGTEAAPTFACVTTIGSNGAVNVLRDPAIGSANATWIRFDSTNNNRLVANESVSVVSLNTVANDGSTIIGTSASSGAVTNTSDFLNVGGAYPIYGYHEVADIGKRSFPRTLSLFSGRLALGGFPDAPMRVALSNTLDSATPGTFYNNFQTILEPLSDDNALYFELTGNADDAVTGLADFQNSLFIFCRKGIYRVSAGGNSATVTPTAFSLSFIASIGCVNAQSITRVDKTLYFLSQAGVYDITPTIQAGDFTAGERSLKIKSLFNLTSSSLTEAASWMQYDPILQEVYVGIPSNDLITGFPSQGCSKLYIYNILRDAWSEFTYGYSGSWRNTGAAILLNGTSKGRDVIIWTNIIDLGGGSLAGVVPVLLDQETCIDGAWTQTKGGAALETPGFMLSGTTTVTNVSQNEYSFKNTEVRLMPSADIQDCDVFLGGSKLVYGQDWVKTANNSIILLHAYEFNQLDVEKITEDFTRNYCIYVDRVKKVYGVDYTVEFDLGVWSIVWLTGVPPTGSVVTTGILYESWHYTPMMYADAIFGDKRFQKYIGYYKNTELLNTYYDNTFLNQVTNQDIQQLINLPILRGDVNLAFVYEDKDSGYTSADLYGFSDLYWDNALTDITPSAIQSTDTSRIVENILGSSYGLQVVNYTRSDGFFELVGFELVSRPGSRNSKHWSN